MGAGTGVIADGAVSCRDIAGMAHGQDFRLVAPTLEPQDAALRGLFVRRALRCGLSLHMTDAVDLHDLTTQSMTHPGITLTLFLQGGASVALAGRSHTVGAGRSPCGRPVPTGFLYSVAEPDIFERRGVRGEHMRKVSIRIPPDWLEEEGQDGEAGHLLGVLGREHGATLSWPLSQDVVAAAHLILDSAPAVGGAAALLLESRVLDILARTLDSLAGRAESVEKAAAPARAEARVKAAQAYMAAHLDDDMALADVARHAAVSVSTLQRLFRQVAGMPVCEYLRGLRIDRARAFLESGEGTVTEAAFRAGYTSPANFATAFKRHYGISPSQCRRRR